MELNVKRLTHPEGGSLSPSQVVRQFVKSYTGPMERGGEKLRREFGWLDALPDDLRPYFSEIVAFHDDRTSGYTALHLKLDPRPAFAKAILLGQMTPHRTADTLSAVLDFLTTRLYPLRSEPISGPDLYQRFHGDRLRRAVPLLAEVPAIRPLVTGPGMIVNGRECPSIASIVAWLDDHVAEIFTTSRLVFAHGDAHLDNILVSTDGPVAFRLVDPRGESLIPGHYDLAKLLKALRIGYDLIHYGGYKITTQINSAVPSINLGVSDAFTDHYRAGIEVLLRALPAYAAAEGVTEQRFARHLLASELAHIISFASYHAHHPAGCDADRVSAFLGIAALLADDLMHGVCDPTRVLPIWAETT
jgi:hypothetical protein